MTQRLKAGLKLASGQRLPVLLGDDHLTGNPRLAVYLVSLAPNQVEQLLNYFPPVNKLKSLGKKIKRICVIKKCPWAGMYKQTVLI